MVETMDGTYARALLGVADHATNDDVRRAFRQRARATHPDHGGDAEAFTHTKRAFKTLQTQPRVGVSPVVAAPTLVFDPNRRIDTYDCTPSRSNRPLRASFQDVFDAAVRQRVAAS